MVDVAYIAQLVPVLVSQGAELALEFTNDLVQFTRLQPALVASNEKANEFALVRFNVGHTRTLVDGSALNSYRRSSLS